MKRNLLLMSGVLVFVFTGQAQAIQNSIRRGMIKVKFSAEITSLLSDARISKTSRGLTTGIASVDAVVQRLSATDMYRLFPYDAKNESKLQKQGLHLWYVVELNDNTDTEMAVSQFKQLKEIVAASKIIDSMNSMITQLNHSKVNSKKTPK
jgi:hypothetical protein